MCFKNGPRKLRYVRALYGRVPMDCVGGLSDAKGRRLYALHRYYSHAMGQFVTSITSARWVKSAKYKTCGDRRFLRNDH